MATPGKPAARVASRRREGRIRPYLLTLGLLVVVNFILPRLLPGDPIKVLTAAANSGAGAHEVDAATKAKLSHYYGLDRSLPEQFGHYLGGLSHGDLGTSIRYNTPVAKLLLEHGKWTLLLALGGVAVACVVSSLAGIHSGWRRGPRSDRGLLFLFVALSNFPSYVMAAVALILFGVKLHWFPPGGAQTPFVHYGPLRQVGDIGWHLALPASVMALNFTFIQYLIMRGGMVTELGSDYLLGGRVKGLTERRLKYRYTARNALLPVVTEIGIDLVVSVSVASVFVERVFAYPGLGQLMFDSIFIRDYPVMQGCFLAVGTLVVAINLLVEFLYPLLDPRVR